MPAKSPLKTQLSEPEQAYLERRLAGEKNALVSIMSELKALPLNDAIRLRWVLRDIRARRFLLSPPDPADIETLARLGYIEIKGDEPILTPAGLDEI